MAFLIAMLLAMPYTLLALAAGAPAQVVFTTDAPCPVTVNLFSYTNPAGQPGTPPANTTTPFTLDTAPSTTVLFFYPASVVCNGTTYQLLSVSPTGLFTSGASGDSTTVTGHYSVPASTDATAPVWVVSDISAEATGSTGAIVNYTVSVSDSDDAVSSQSCSPASGDVFVLGATMVNCTATDTHGNTGMGSFHVNVVDTTRPAITVPSDMSVTTLNASGAIVSFVASAQDLVDGMVAVNCSPVSGSTFSVGVTPVNCSATDTHGNPAFASFNVTVVYDAPPVLTLPANMIVSAKDASGATVNFTASAYDLVDGAVPVTCSPTSGSLFPIGSTLVNCSASDSHGSTTNGSFTVSVQYSTDIKCGGIMGHQILQPLNADGTSAFKKGRTVPIKFRVCGADGRAITTPGVVTNFRLVQIISNGSVKNVDEAVVSTSAHEAFRAGAQQWIFNLSTKDLDAGNTYVYLITLNDGSTIQFQFTLK